MNPVLCGFSIDGRLSVEDGTPAAAFPVTNYILNCEEGFPSLVVVRRWWLPRRRHR